MIDPAWIWFLFRLENPNGNVVYKNDHPLIFTSYHCRKRINISQGAKPVSKNNSGADYFFYPCGQTRLQRQISCLGMPVNRDLSYIFGDAYDQSSGTDRWPGCRNAFKNTSH
jgi:hypothetical protein